MANWHATLLAALSICRAVMLVRFVPLDRWRKGLGTRVDPTSPTLAASPSSSDHAAALARRYDRAAMRLPFAPRCLPHAIALQRALRRRNIPARLVIAMRRDTREPALGYHAWVESGGRMLAGACERGDYHAVLAFDTGG